VAKRRADELLERMELTARADDLVEKFSTGMKQRVAISKALIANPPILLLDEPTLGLDPQAARNLRELIAQLKAEGHTILLTTHYMEEADQLSDRIGIIDQGKIIALDTPEPPERAHRPERCHPPGDRRLARRPGRAHPGNAARRGEPGGAPHGRRARAAKRALGGQPACRELARRAARRDRPVNYNGTRLVNMNIQRPRWKMSSST
jgi:ABC-type multidrug transport system ATPase subunit